MKLGIAVVYLVKDEDEKLLDLHFRQIKKYTTAPYNIYAAVNRLQPRFREKLEANPSVVICDVPKTELRISEEHAFNLEHLFKRAIDDGVTHVAVFHVDSFPVKPGWDQELAGKINDTCVFAAVMRKENHDLKPNLMCLLFEREFYLKYRPRLNLSKDELASKEYQEYSQKYQHFLDTGVGYGFKAFGEGLSWYPLIKSNKREEHPLIGVVYGDLVFHLGAAARDDKIFNTDIAASGQKRGMGKLLSGFMPPWLKAFLRQRLQQQYKAANQRNQEIFDRVKVQLLEDPDGYLDDIR